jgi:excisionase family DNA binding protein
VSDQSIRRWVKAGELRAYKPKKEYRITESDLEEFLKERRVPLVQARLLNFEQEQRPEIPDVVLAAARRQAEHVRQAATRAEQSGRAQSYFMHHDNAAVVRLLEYPPDEVAGALIELAHRCIQLEDDLARATEATAEEAAEKARGASA